MKVEEYWSVKRYYQLARELPNGQTAVVISGEGLTPQEANIDADYRVDEMLRALGARE